MVNNMQLLTSEQQACKMDVDSLLVVHALMVLNPLAETEIACHATPSSSLNQTFYIHNLILYLKYINFLPDILAYSL